MKSNKFLYPTKAERDRLKTAIATVICDRGKGTITSGKVTRRDSGQVRYFVRIAGASADTLAAVRGLDAAASARA